MIKPHTWITISKSALEHNINEIKKAIGKTQLGIVLKSNAYGHGAQTIASILEANKTVDWFCVASLSEAFTLRKHNVKKPIIALSYLDDDYEQAVLQDIHCAIYTLEDAIQLNEAAKAAGKKAFVHIKVDTGMSRLGIMPEHALAFMHSLQKLTHLTKFGVFTHLCDTANPDQSFSKNQFDTFDHVVSALKEHGFTFECVHAQSSSALCVAPKHPYTMLRAGATAYGLWKSEEHKQLMYAHCAQLDLQPVLTWKTRIIQIKDLCEGCTVGYDRTFKVTKPTRIAIVPIGYWEGYQRNLSNKGMALIRDQYAMAVGIVSMNLTAFDVSALPEVKIGDEVTLLGNHPGITAQECAQTAGIITNQMVTQINPDIPKIIIDEVLITTKTNSAKYKKEEGLDANARALINC